jgi:hypothetical protein
VTLATFVGVAEIGPVAVADAAAKVVKDQDIGTASAFPAMSDAPVIVNVYVVP